MRINDRALTHPGSLEAADLRSEDDIPSREPATTPTIGEADRRLQRADGRDRAGWRLVRYFTELAGRCAGHAHARVNHSFQGVRMTTNAMEHGAAVPSATTHAQAAELLRRPFAPGAIGFRAMTKVPLNGNPFGGAQIAAYIGAQSVLQRLNAVVPGRWHQEFKLVDPPPGSKRLYMACRLTVTLPITEDGPDIEAVYEDVGEMDGASRAGLKALYSDARKRAAVAAGIGAYLYTLEPVVLPIGPKDRQVHVIRRSGKADVLALSPGTEHWLRHGYQQRMSTDAVRRDLGEMLAHGEPERGMGQGEAAEQPDGQSPGQAFWDGELAQEEADAAGAADGAADAPAQDRSHGNGVVVVDFGGLGPDAA